MPDYWYPTVDSVGLIATKLAAAFFEDYEEPMSRFFAKLDGQDGLNRLQSALALPQQPYYRSLHIKAAALLRSLVKNHAFIDGNKRMGMVTTFVFLTRNNHFLLTPNDEMVSFAVELAASEPDLPLAAVTAWINRYCFYTPRLSYELKRRLERVRRELQVLRDSDYYEVDEKFPKIERDLEFLRQLVETRDQRAEMLRDKWIPALP